MIPRIAAALAVGLAIAAPACGGTDDRLSKTAYQLQTLRIQATDGEVASELFFDLVAGPRPKRLCAAKARRFHRVLEDVVDAVAALRPPERIEALHQAFLVQARRSVAVVREAADDVERGALQCGSEYNRRVYRLPSTDRAEEILSTLRDMGYVLGGE